MTPSSPPPEVAAVLAEVARVLEAHGGCRRKRGSDVFDCGIKVNHFIGTFHDHLAVALSPYFQQAQAKALRDAADDLDALQTPDNDHYSQRDPALWLNHEADRLAALTAAGLVAGGTREVSGG